MSAASTVASKPAAASAADPQPASQGLKGKQLALVFLALLLAMAVSSLSETIAATALPTIVGDLGGVDIMQWVETTYILATTITMPIYGKLGDLLGRKKLLMLALSLYAAGKVVCGLAPSMAFLICGRAISGIGGGGLMILSQAILADVVPPSRVGSYMGIIGSVFAVCNVLGPLLGGWFVQVTGWRMIFWFTVPLAAVALLGIAKLLPSDATHVRRAPIDIWGMTAIAAMVSCLVLALAWGGTRFAWESPVIIGLICGFIGAVAFLIVAEKHAAAPVLPLSLFNNRNFVLASFTGFLINICFMGLVSYLPTFFQIVDRLTPEIAGLMCAPMSIGILITSTASGHILTKTGKYKWMTLAMCAICAVGFVLLTNFLRPSTPIVEVLAILFFLGFGIGLGLQILTIVVQNEFPHSLVGTATASNNFFRQIGATLGTSLVGSLFTSRLVADVSPFLPKADNISLASLTPIYVEKLPASIQSIIATGYSEALVPLFGYFVPLCILGFVAMLFLEKHPLATTINHGGAAGKAQKHSS